MQQVWNGSIKMKLMISLKNKLTIIRQKEEKQRERLGKVTPRAEQ